jgi:hypothetical protein
MLGTDPFMVKRQITGRKGKVSNESLRQFFEEQHHPKKTTEKDPNIL